MPVIGITLGAMVLLIGGLYLYQLKRSQPLHEENLPIPKIIPTLTLAPGQIAIYTFYIQGSSQYDPIGTLKLKKSDARKTFKVDTGTLIFLQFGVGKFHISTSSPQAIFFKRSDNLSSLPANYQYRRLLGLPKNAIEALEVVRSGFGTIIVTETN